MKYVTKTVVLNPILTRRFRFSTPIYQVCPWCVPLLYFLPPCTQTADVFSVATFTVLVSEGGRYHQFLLV